MGIPDRTVHRLLLAGALTLLAACTPPKPAQPQAADTPMERAQESVADVIEPVAEAVEGEIASAVVPVVVAVRGAVAEVVAVEAPAPVVTPAGVDLIVRYEISSPAYYVKRLQQPIWPGAASGITWGIGYDGGHQTATRIAADWAAHPDAPTLATTAGIVGQRAQAALPAYRHILTPLPLAQGVFSNATLPSYAELTARTFANGWDGLPPGGKDALVATVYNRGASMRGDRRREMRVLRDECVPAADTDCMAAQFRSMCRLWVGTSVERGLCDRYNATAALAVSA